MAAERLMVLFGDDSVEVHYAEGSRLLLSPCGCEYLHEAALPANAHPLQPAETIRQRVAFVVSAYREQLLRALDFRNKFSSRPYLPSCVIPPERKEILLSDISEIRWPDSATADLTRCIDNGNVKISSVDGYAHLYLSELQQEFTVEFLCKVSQSSAASLSSSQKNRNYQTGAQYEKPSKNSVAEMSLKQTRVENKNKYGCAEDKNRESIKPKDHGDRDGIPLFYSSCSYEYTWITQCWSVSSCPEEWKYPLSLALMCCNLDTVKTCRKNNHTSAKADVLTNLTDPETHETVSRLPTALPLSCRAPHLHRFIHGRTNITEIYPGDDSFFKSEGALFGKYFVHYAIQKGTKKVPETDGQEMLPALLYDKVIPSIGRLIVYSDHKVHAAFWDGLTLNMVWEFSSFSNEIQINEDIGWCKLTTPDGVQQLIQISHPGVYERSADAELEKIRRFNSDRLLQFSFIQQNDWLRALSDNAVHGVLGMWSWAIVIGLRKKSDFTEVTLAGFLASVIDVDHFFLAGSLSLKLQALPIIFFFSVGCSDTSTETTSSLFYRDSRCGSGIEVHYAPFQAKGFMVLSSLDVVHILDFSSCS
ncbi:hypothetical protein WISP_08684 [Willisornis vidua]|uniref:DUF4524 domain-containing protein n=1 Tax=Willisornis vidua TaxID=1566151 RepID=A0ABQ9DXF0_9PASS|nr:hypothetical protein WISP_08684 [Willisornis vidua]